MPKSAYSSQNANLDVLRSIAVLTVVFYHGLQMYATETRSMFKWGHYGVLVFFVHTSLVLLMSLDRFAMHSPHIALRFYVQRAFRIYPLSVLCVLTVFFFHVPCAHYDQYAQPSAATVISNLLLIQNFGFASVSGPLWSLPYEVQMYLMLPFIYFLLQRFPSRRMMSLLVVLSVLLGCLRLVSPVGNIVQYVPCFMGGVLAFWLRSHQKAILPASLWPFVVLALGWLYSQALFPGASFATCLILGSVTGLFRELQPSFLTVLAHGIAKYSYGVYLAHIPLYWLYFYKLPIQLQAEKWALFLVFLIVVPVILFHAIELPLIRFGKKF